MVKLQSVWFLREWDRILIYFRTEVVYLFFFFLLQNKRKKKKRKSRLRENNASACATTTSACIVDLCVSWLHFICNRPNGMQIDAKLLLVRTAKVLRVKLAVISSLVLIWSRCAFQSSSKFYNGSNYIRSDQGCGQLAIYSSVNMWPDTVPVNSSRTWQWQWVLHIYPTMRTLAAESQHTRSSETNCISSLVTNWQWTCTPLSFFSFCFWKEGYIHIQGSTSFSLRSFRTRLLPADAIADLQ